ncbi:hypothetical protein [Runella aurantiaca]|uniref:LPXTG cell wall anchor domain-containing protein n=1 Tax=Runella aurantiaca TaxID=2282308 RepID=A0A369I6A6_9BACT|nr:hypothetical protein [Runella aurantiaca]RDB03775.1 hypothetical protein DVG78_22080 [Runella aurantiaca]
MKKLFFLVAQFMVSSVWADEVGNYNQSSQSSDSSTELLVVAGVVAIAALFYIRYRRARNKP